MATISEWEGTSDALGGFFFSHRHAASSRERRNSSSRERSDNFERSNRGERFDRGGDDRRDERDRNRLLVTKRSFSREKEERSREREQRGPADPVRRVASMTDERDRARSREKNGGWERVPRSPLRSEDAFKDLKFSSKSGFLLSVSVEQRSGKQPPPPRLRRRPPPSPP